MNPLHVEHVAGPDAAPRALPDLLIEVPHGADTQAHYDALFARLQGELPAHLERFFHVNTDVGAWSIARAIAERHVLRVPTATVRLIRCGIPRTFIDVNRVIGEDRPPGMTPGLPSYVTHPDDITELVRLHGEYTEAVRASYDEICGAGGRALIPHTYAPRSVPIAQVDDTIVEQLTAVYVPEVLERCPLRAQVDLITATPDGEELAPPGLPEAVVDALAAIDLTAHRGGTYTLHPSTMGAHWSALWPGKVLCFEVRRDLVTEWDPFVPKTERPDAIARVAAAIAECL